MASRQLRRQAWTICRISRPVYRYRRLLALCLLSALISACSHAPDHQAALDAIEPLQWQGAVVSVSEVALKAPTPDLLALDEEMSAFVERYTGGLSSERQRLTALHRAIRSAGVLSLQYDPQADGTAAEAFHSGSANCLSYAHLFVALAREAGLDAKFQTLEIRPQWTRIGERVAVRLHVNVLIDLRYREQYMADIDPLEPADVAGTSLISDADAAALHHNNLAMEALAAHEYDLAWAHGVQALSLSPGTAHLWVNLGAVYRQVGQHRQAEQNYLHALELDPRERSAMTNLAMLYGIEGRDEERDYWLARIESYRQRNPFYHAWLGDTAAESNDWAGALVHYQKALQLRPQDSQLLYATGIIYYRLTQLDDATRLITQAIEQASQRSEVLNYETQLAAIRREQHATL